MNAAAANTRATKALWRYDGHDVAPGVHAGNRARKSRLLRRRWRLWLRVRLKAVES